MARHSRPGPSDLLPRRSPGDAGEDTEELNLPPVLLPEEESGRSAYLRVAAWVLGAALLVILAIWPTGIVSWPFAGGGAGSQAAAADTAIAFGEDGTPARFDRLLNSLESSLAVFERRHQDFERGRVACDALIPVYRRLDALIVSLAMERPASRRTSAPERQRRYDALIDEATAAERRFDASGCPRP